MTTNQKRHLKASAALIGSGVAVIPLLQVLLEAVAEVIDQPVFAETISKWFGAGTLVSVLILTVVYRLIAWAMNSMAERKAESKGVVMAENPNAPIKI